MALTILGLLLVLAAAWWVTWPLLSPAGGDAFGSVDAGPGLLAERSANELARDNALAAIREAEFDHRLGKLTDADYERLRADQEDRALSAIAAIERGEGGGRVRTTAASTRSGSAIASRSKAGARSASGAAFCTACGKSLGGARFCSSCGKQAAGTAA